MTTTILLIIIAILVVGNSNKDKEVKRLKQQIFFRDLALAGKKKT